ncbi:fungal-specific transcription factor domain-containing protein [Plectosphaerella plurivora]|uniref:Fungal-specific transcription factor domain-containing protein n=1 Tax=Plectosphaerella plurivora TaxID=936078 RepID=A0A9P9A6S2_9PEZI|nr:fungal-specific transcription factor domain-containing protein [Plectosphaerella plurivora]
MASLPSKTESTVCERCASIKQACSGFPCRRCARLGLPCNPRWRPGSSPRTDTTTPPKARIRRVHTGCMACKMRKKKCDEVKPKCGDCRRLCLDCTWPTNSPSTSTSTRVSANTTSMIDVAWPNASEQWASSIVLDDQVRDADADGTAGNMRSLSMSVASTESHLDASIADLLCQLSSAANVADPAVLDAVSAAPLDDLNLDLDLEWPTLSPDASWLDNPPAPSPSPSQQSVVVAAASPSLSIYTPSLTPDMQSPLDKALLNHYSTVVASVLSRCPSQHTLGNPYLTHLLPMAMSSPTVLHSILALSATHWQRLRPEMQSRALLHRGRATQTLADMLPHVDGSTVDVALVSCLLLCMTELFDGSSTGWKFHLQGAKRLFTTLKDQLGEAASNTSSHYRFLVQLTRFLDSAATTSTCKPPLIEDQVESSTPETHTHDPQSTAAGDDAAVYGIPKELFHLVDRINELASKRSTRVDTASESAFRQEADRVREHLDNWALDYGGLAGAATSLGAANDDVLRATTAYEWALRLRLHQITEGYSLADPHVSECVGHILDAAQGIRYGSALETCLLFPLVMAGGASDELEHRMVIHDRLMVMERTCGFGYIHQSRALVERVWTKREGTKARVNWARIRHEEMGGLAIF